MSANRKNAARHRGENRRIYNQDLEEQRSQEATKERKIERKKRIVNK